MPLLTIFTATYNRGHLIGNLYESLKRQSSFDFEWLVVDDGSTDGTEDVFKKILAQRNQFDIRYYRQENQGLIRSMNRGISLARGKYLAKIDSDDYVTDDYMSYVHAWLNEIEGKDNVYAVGGLRVDHNGKPLKGVWPKIPKEGYVDASDIERKYYDLDADMSEAWNLEVLRKYPFPVWETEKFAPEQIVFFQIAIDGYKIRWRPIPLVVCEYQEGGLTLGASKLERENPMGYAMMFRQMLNRPDFSWLKKFKCAMNCVALSSVGGNILYPLKGNHKVILWVAFFPGFFLGIRRKHQFINK